MAIVLGDNRYGKAETWLVRIDRSGERHRITLDNPGEVFCAADRPFGLIEGAVLREDAPPAGLAWW